jgi:flagellar biosynthesis protein FlhB
MSEKTIDPTPHRRQRAREEGHAAKSQDLVSAVVLLSGVGALMWLGGGLADFLMEYCRRQLGGAAWSAADADFAASQWNAAIGLLGRRLLPILGLLAAAGVAANVLQTGFLFLPGRAGLDPGRVNPVGGWRRIFSSAGAVRLGFGLFKLAAVAAVGCWTLYDRRDALAGLSAMAPGPMAAQIVRILTGAAIWIGAALLILAILDYGYQRWRFERDLRMTPQELREEIRNLEGDPRWAVRRKQLHRKLAEPPSSSPAENN